MATIIVPAFNESAVIADCLESIVDQPGVDNVIVACNGCTDDTAEIVQKKFPEVRCLELHEASKVQALNAAEREARELGMVFPVFYIDADTRLGRNAVGEITRAMESGSPLLAAPTPIIETSKSAWTVRQYYKTWTNLPYVKQGVIATCSYVISERGRARFDRFEDVVSDDGYVRCRFHAHEISNVPTAKIYIQAPRDVVSLIKIRTRARLGWLQLMKTKRCPCREPRRHARVILRRLFSKDLLSVVVYTLITLISRIRARLQLRRLDDYLWERDRSWR